MNLKLSEISINGRHRKELGDVEALAASIRTVGLLQPVVVDSKHKLIAGQRRVEAFKKLGLSEIPVFVAKTINDVRCALIAERDENVCRLEFAPTEAAAMADALRPFEKSEAKEREKVGRGRPKKGVKKSPKKRKKSRDTTAAAVGMSHLTLKKIQEVIASGYADLIAAMDRTGNVNSAFKAMKDRHGEEERKRRAAEAAASLPPDKDFGVKSGDFREVGKELADESVSLIFTDPPYDRKTLPLYGDMAKLAARVLIHGGSLICYLGQYQIGEVCQLLSPHLRLWWTLACIHTGTSARMTEYGVVVKWKPMLWFVKGTRDDKQTFVEDAIESEMQKESHKWQQGLPEATYYIKQLTKPDELVFDPFCGGATTAVAAKSLQRRWLTCDVDKAAVQIARRRIHDYA